MNRQEADRLVEGDRVAHRELRGTVVGATKNCVSIQWDGRETPEIFTTDDMRNISKEGRTK
jgi:hypothetical protein